MSLECVIGMGDKMPHAKLCAIDYFLPQREENNEFLVADMQSDWSAEEIYEKTGIRKRHIAAPDECASDLAARAAERLFLAHDGLKEKIDFVLFCSQSPDYALPTTACLLQSRLQLSKSCGAMDINQGCAGFIYGLAVAKGLIESGVAKHVLLLNAETYSKYIDKRDKTTRTIFGDGAAATWISGDVEDGLSIGTFVFGTDGAGAENLIVRNSGARMEGDGTRQPLFMDGPEIFQFTLSVVPKTVKVLLEKAELGLGDIDLFVFHQANAFILEHLRKKLAIPNERFLLDLAETGNTVSASIPIVLARAIVQGKVKSGMKIMLIGFGVGYSWGGCILEK